MSENPAAASPSELTLEQKIQLTGGKDFWRLHSVPEAGLPEIMTSDGPHGLRMQAEGGDALGLNDSVEATCFPPAVGLSASWNPRLAEAVGAALGREALAAGVSVVLGPGMNIKRSPLCGRNFEYFSEDPVLAGEMAIGYVTGMQGAGVGASVKHFALNNQETDRMRVDVEVDERTMHEIYLRAFRAVVQRAQPWTVMCSYNAVNGTTLAENRFLLTEVLREQWGFTGLVVSDWGAVVDRPAAVAAGLDLQMPADPAAEEDLRRAVDSGECDLGALDRAARNVTRLIRRAAETADPDAAYDREAHHDVALDAARQAIVLLKNDGILPLAESGSGSDAQDIAVIGDFAEHPRYQGAGSSHVNPTRLVTALDGIRELTGAQVPYARGFVPGRESDAALVKEAVDLAQGAGTVLMFLGLGEDVESEGYDRTDLELPSAQIELLREVAAVNPRVVVLLSNGSAVRLPEEVLAAPAVLETWLLGQAGGTAVAEILFGRVSPSGKLAESFPRRLEDTPSFLFFPGEHGRVRYGEGLFVGYRGLDARGDDVAFPFGHGLSYTSFEYGGATVRESEGGLVATLEVTNTGERAGREVVQAYVSVPGSRVARAPRELKGFADVELEPGRSREVTISIPRDHLQYWSVDQHDWRVEGGAYRVELGSSSRDLRCWAEVVLEGDEPVPTISLRSIPLEVREVPGGAEKFEHLVGGTPIATDPEVSRMMEQIPLNRFTGLAGYPREQLQEFVDDVNRHDE